MTSKLKREVESLRYTRDRLLSALVRCRDQLAANNFYYAKLITPLILEVQQEIENEPKLKLKRPKITQPYV